MAASILDLIVPEVKPSDGLDRIVRSINTLARGWNGLVRNGQVTRTAQDAWKVGGGGGPPLDVPSGGTGVATLTAHGVLVGEGTSPVVVVGPGEVGTVLQGMGASADPVFTPTPQLGASGTTGKLILWDEDLSATGYFQAAAGLWEFHSADGGLFEFGEGQLILFGQISGAVGVTTQPNAGGYNFNLPITAGTAGQVLTSQAGGSTAMTWTTPTTVLAVGTTTITSGTSGRVLYDNAGVLGEKTVTGSGSVVLATTPDFVSYLTVGGLGVGVLLQDSGGGNARLQTPAIFAFDSTQFWCRDAAGSVNYFVVNTGGNTITIGQTAGSTIAINGATTINGGSSALTLTSATSTSQVGFDLSQGGTSRWTFYVPASSTDLRIFNRALSADALTVTSADSQFAFAGPVQSPNFKPTATQTTVNGSVSGTAVFSQPFQGTSLKRVLIYFNALNGTASYTFPTAFTNTPSVVATNDVGVGVVTARSTTAVTVTGAVTSGFLELVGY